MNRYKLGSLKTPSLLRAINNYLDEGCLVYTDIVVALNPTYF